MYVHKNDLDSISNFICGYLACYGQFNPEINNGIFSDWISRIEQKSSLDWSAHIYRILANENSAKAYDLAFELLLEFLNNYKSKLN